MSTPGWQIDESSCAGRENLDAGHVERYDAKEEAHAAAEVALLKDAGLGPGSLVVKLGVGTGQLAVEVAPACDQVVAVDVSEPMLARLRRKVADLGLGNVTIVNAGFLSYQHVGPSGGLHLLAVRAPPSARLLEGARAQPASRDAQSGRCAAPLGCRLQTSLPQKRESVSRLGARLARTRPMARGAALSLRSMSATSTRLSHGCLSQ
jgi:hypothetical protein